MVNSFEIHDVIQNREFDFPGFISEHRDAIDTHVLGCSECHQKVVGYTEDLPQLRKKMTVALPAEMNGVPRLRQLSALNWGQCLLCGCVVTQVAWSEEYATKKFYSELAQILRRPLEDAYLCGKHMQLSNLPLSTVELRRLRDSFWLPDGSYIGAEKRDIEEGEVVRDLPETIGDFINRLMSLHSGISYNACRKHWL